MSDLYPGKWFTVTAMCMLFFMAGASANEKNSISEHDDLGGAQLEVQGTESALCESGVSSGFAYIVGSEQCQGGLHMVDIRQPKSPSFTGCFSGDGSTHDVQCVMYTGPDAMIFMFPMILKNWAAANWTSSAWPQYKAGNILTRTDRLSTAVFQSAVNTSVSG